MILKTFRAASMADALARVKKELGKDAVILSTRSMKVGGFLGFGAKPVVEITASNQGPAFARQTAPPSDGLVALAQGVTGGVRRQPASAAFAPLNPAAAAYRPPDRSPPYFAMTEPKPDPLVGLSFGPARVETTTTPHSTRATPLQSAAIEPLSPPPAEQMSRVLPLRKPRATTAPFAPVDAASATQIHRELSDIKLLVNQVLCSSPASTLGTGAVPETLFKHYLKLLESRVARVIADQIVGSVRDELTPGELADEAIVRATVLRHLSALIPADEEALRPPVSNTGGRSQRSHIIALVGPTGVGKTTTIAKLAAAYKLRHARSVALITSDTYRIAAVDQLRTYASIIGLPLKVVSTPDEMQEAVEAFSAYDIVMIDTAGRSQHNTDRLRELAAFLDAARPDQTHLVLSSASCESVMLRTAQAFASTRPDRVLFTKLDEAVNFGVLVNVMQSISAELGATTPLSFVTTGQEVPDHIEPGQSDRLARAILDNRFAAADLPPRSDPAFSADAEVLAP